MISTDGELSGMPLLPTAGTRRPACRVIARDDLVTLEELDGYRTVRSLGYVSGTRVATAQSACVRRFAVWGC